MMSFWDLSDGETAANTGKEYEVPSGKMEPIPAGSSVLAVVDEIKWDRKPTGEEYISARWSVIAPDEYKNRKVFHKLWVTDLDPDEVRKNGNDKAVKKRDKARKMLAAIDANAGGKLTQKSGKPTDTDLLALKDKPMITTMMLWSMPDSQNGGMMHGNWVSAVAPKGVKDVEVKPKVALPTGGGGAAARRDDGFGAGAGSGSSGSAYKPTDGYPDDEIPF